jgi:hypothetical protein
MFNFFSRKLKAFNTKNIFNLQFTIRNLRLTGIKAVNPERGTWNAE